MSKLKDKLTEIIPQHRERVQELIEEKGSNRLSEVTVKQAYWGMRGVKSLICETSYVDPMEGVKYGGRAVPQMREELSRDADGEEPLPEAAWWLLLTGEVPTSEEVADVQQQLSEEREVPTYIHDMLRALPADTHPMTMFSAAILALQRDSVYSKKYMEGIPSTQRWEYMYEDCIKLLAKLPGIGALIYRLKYKDDAQISPDSDLDWAANFAHIMGVDAPEYKELARLYFVLHADHESGNVSAHTSHLVGSTRSDIFYSMSGAMNGLAGPLHGLATQTCLTWILDMMNELGGVPTSEQIEKYAWDTLNNDQVIPGYGHAVLRQTDPRFLAEHEFAKKYFPDDPVFKTLRTCYEVIPRVLQEHGLAKNPWPNVDGHSGCLHYHYGIKEMEFYTVLFGIGRGLGLTAQAIWDEALMMPIERPKSISTEWIEQNG